MLDLKRLALYVIAVPTLYGLIRLYYMAVLFVVNIVY